MKKFPQILPVIFAYCFALLFIYASISKILDFANFQVQLAQSPLLSAYAGFISYAVIVAELVIAVLLFIKSTRLAGLYLSLGIMVSFTVYIYLILNYSDFIPCSCGGILEKLGWTEHLIFNIVCVLTALAWICILERRDEKKIYKTIISTASISIVSAGVIIGLFLSSENIIKKENNFTRRFLLHPVIEDKTLGLDNKNYYFAGRDDHSIYLGSKILPQTMINVDTQLVHIEKMKVTPDNFNHTYRNIRVQVKAPYYYFYDGTVPVIFRGKIGDTSARTISFGDAYFSQIVVQDSLRFALRTQSRDNMQFVLASLNLANRQKVELYPSVLEKQIDGVFDVDGRLISSNTQHVIYAYTYRNQFIVMNDSLQVQKRLNTIDTTTTAKIKITALSNGKHKMEAPPLKVNKLSAANRNLLFNQSDLMGKHESKAAWKKAKVVDVYRTDKQEYIGSFYIYNREDQKITDLMATDKYLYVLRGNELIRYQFTKLIIDEYEKTGKAENLKQSRH
ncbi:tellurium resistance protein TerC [Chryseobacterium glaciei]|uniref:Tellurium resistance protein TerC n=1 Tax=Chryseobacterium glaciei TaxID=1685010 RepID=A0A172XTH0_9FLAO|nr:DoxX family protein [Chryseobacterium glaciei]ANF50317.1 tellurium resistance protein TerC [Chryseobacterium glaciei]